MVGYIEIKEFLYKMKSTDKPVNPFGEWLRAKRQARGWSLRELANRAGDVCSPQYISQLEKNAYPGKDGEPMQAGEIIVERLAAALGEPVNEARALANYPRIDPDGDDVGKFQDALFNFQKLSSPAQTLLKKHFRETIEFLLEFEQPKEKMVMGKGAMMELVDESEKTDSEDEED